MRRGLGRTLKDKSTLIFQHWHRVRIARVYIETIDARRGDRQKLRGTPVFGCASSTSLEIEICTNSPYSIWVAIHIAIAVRSSSGIFDYTLVSFRCSNAKSFISIHDSCPTPTPRRERSMSYHLRPSSLCSIFQWKLCTIFFLFYLITQLREIEKCKRTNIFREERMMNEHCIWTVFRWAWIWTFIYSLVFSFWNFKSSLCFKACYKLFRVAYFSSSCD